MQSHGCVVEEASLGFDPARLWECWRVHRHWLAGGRLLAYYRNPATRDLLKPEAQWEVEQGLRLSAIDVYDASIVRTEWYLALRKLLAAFDCVVMPSAQVFPFNANIHWPKAIANRPMDCYLRWMEVVTPVTLSGCPAISVPVGFSPEGLPIGMQIIGRAHADFDILRIAYAYEQMTGWVTKRLPPKLMA